MKKWKQFMIASTFIMGLGVATLSPASVSAINVFSQCGSNPSAAVCKSQADSASSFIKTAIDTSLYVLGMIAVLMIVIGGIRYTISNGNASQVKEAKDTIMYAVIGLVVAILAFAIVNFVVSRF